MKSDRIHHIDASTYKKLYTESLEDPSTFWSAYAEKFITWYRKWDQIVSGDVSSGKYRWFEGATLNVSYNCIDRHIKDGHGTQVAFFWESNAGETIKITYNSLLAEVSKLANVLKARSVNKGDRICIYMPMIPEAVYAMLACTRIGAIHTVVFGGFSAEALRSRVHDAGCSVIISADVSTRGDKTIPLKERVDEILPSCPTVHTVLVVQTQKQSMEETDIVFGYRHLVENASIHCLPEHMEAEDPLFILYTSGSTGTPKGVLHTTGGYLLYAAMTHKYVFDYHDGDIYWCTADVGWITGHSYIVYGPLCNRATSVLFEGTPTYPDASRYWNIVDKYRVNIFYSTPTTIRMLMAQGNSFVTKTSRKSLITLGTVGEPINPEAWRWYYDIVGSGDCSIVDTWWQTETGGHAIAPMPGVTSAKPGAAMLPFFGINPVIVTEEGVEINGEGEGTLLLKGSWPGQMRNLYNNHERFLDTYLRPYPGYYYTGDGAKRDVDGHIWITGRVDDTMNIAGRLIGTAEVESALVLHPAIAEAAVVAVPHAVKGFSLYAYVCPLVGEVSTPKLTTELLALIQTHIGSFAKPERIMYVTGLPKTRSGKIMRRILRAIAQDEVHNLGDISTLAEPEVIQEIIQITRTYTL
jgi:acetyl-CoA synthetase